MAYSASVANALLFREAARDVGVVLTDEGGDPCFGGPNNLSLLLEELVDDGAGDAPGASRARSYLGTRRTGYDDLEAMLMPEVQSALADDVRDARLASQFQDPSWKTFTARLMALNVTVKGGHHLLPKIDALSAGYGVLARSPLFDRAIVETAFAIPPRLRVRRGVDKYVLRRAVRDLVPRAILEAKKIVPSAPLPAWLQGPLLTHARERLVDGLAPYRLFEPKYLERLVAGRRRWRRSRRMAKIWTLLTLEAWLRSVFL